MGWLDSFKLLCALSETITGVDNALVGTDLPVTSYGVISNLPSKGPGPPHTLRILFHIDFYMDGMLSSVQGGLEQQR